MSFSAFPSSSPPLALRQVRICREWFTCAFAFAFASALAFRVRFRYFLVEKYFKAACCSLAQLTTSAGRSHCLACFQLQTKLTALLAL